MPFELCSLDILDLKDSSHSLMLHEAEVELCQIL